MTETIQHVRKFKPLAIDVTIRGTSPLVVHNFNEKAKQEIRDKQQKAAKRAKETRDPHAEFLLNRYVDGEGRECIPITAIKKSMVTAGTSMDNLTKVGIRQAVFVDSIATPGSPLVPIENIDGSPAVGSMREDAVTIGINTRGLTYRPEYPTWKVRVRIAYNPTLISKGQLLELISAAGWGVGICEGRPEKTSALGWGRYEIAEHADVD